MTHESLVDDGWAETIELLGGEELIAGSARETKAFLRPRGVRSACDLLRLTLAYCLGKVGMRGVVAWAAASGIADISDVALLGRLRNAGPWLQQLIGHLLKREEEGLAKGRLIRILDATSVAKAGVHEKKNNGLWRMHCAFDLEREQFDFLEITDQSEAELIDRVPVVAGEIRIGDRAYLQAERIAKVMAQGGDVVVRAPWKNVRWLDASGKPFDLIGHLKSCREEVIETPVWLGLKKGEPLKMRLIALRKSEAAAQEARRKINKEAKAKGTQVRQETLIAAGFVILVTSLDQDEFDADTVLKLYRMRWRIELAFKRLKSLIGLRAPPAKDPRIAKPWILAHFLIALVTEPLSQELGVSPP
ncbi:transposase [Mesorhizobium sp.]|uniref:transposase n=1 Tax=Mesorhizobium sp. TaxID=1871066 RepID=UPI000FE81588|nr:transposase [Mesorhizobium sp.]RWK27574.1 MAG: IS4/IS5 family transposase [Mesorhizobium sp.]RWK59667.1 MAG: IS4/IS5 family transposase [Mesorhizobium sp.]RWK68245.1 MAG: IS4/IS5 family transposase [Mesorhizobium sp.]RWK73184.1 MAG: IS4/IS5 family transposase [Mesorhizobium sp.]RWK96357.1 MAG: IS4/IS5 family transposase [Mesorhizobium sp.]